MPNNIIPGSEPIYIKGNKTGFLFIHGFTAAPYEGRELASQINDNLGCTVSVPLLPGHGISPSALIGITWRDWYNCVKNKYYELRNVCDKIFICGQSMGGTLALHLASHYPANGIITLAGAVFLKDWRLKFLPFARKIWTYQYKSRGPDIKNKALKPQIPSYRKYPLESVIQLLELLKHTRDDLPEIKIPALLIHAKKDHTVHFDNLNYIYENISSKRKNKLILEESYHVISIDLEKGEVFGKVIEFMESILIYP